MRKTDSMLEACQDALADILQSNPNAVIMGSDFVDVRDKLPTEVQDRYFEMGIAEQNLVGAASGMSDNGVIPIVYAFCSFLSYRAYEFIRTDICMQKKNVKLIGVGAGIDFCFAGPSHHATEALGALRSLPRLDIIYPATPIEVYRTMTQMMESDMPTYVRLEREKGRELFDENYESNSKCGIWLKKGRDVTIISSGSISCDCMEAANQLEEEGIEAGVLHMPYISPFDVASVIEASANSKAILTVDEHNRVGGIGSAVAEVLADNAIASLFSRLGLDNTFAVGYGYRSDVRELNGIGVKEIIEKARHLASMML